MAAPTSRTAAASHRSHRAVAAPINRTLSGNKPRQLQPPPAAARATSAAAMGGGGGGRVVARTGDRSPRPVCPSLTGTTGPCPGCLVSQPPRLLTTPQPPPRRWWEGDTAVSVCVSRACPRGAGGGGGGCRVSPLGSAWPCRRVAGPGPWGCTLPSRWWGGVPGGGRWSPALRLGSCCVLRRGGGGYCTWNATLCCSSRPKGAYGTTDEAFVLILLVCLSQPDSNSNRLHTGGQKGRQCSPLLRPSGGPAHVHDPGQWAAQLPVDGAPARDGAVQQTAVGDGLDPRPPAEGHPGADGAVRLAGPDVHVLPQQRGPGPVGGGVPPARDALEGKGPQRPPQKRLDGRLEEVAEAVGGRLLSVTKCH